MSGYPSGANEYSVETYSDNGALAARLDTLNLREAWEQLRSTPHSSLCVRAESGTVLRDFMYSPKHPCPDYDTLAAMVRS